MAPQVNYVVFLRGPSKIYGSKTEISTQDISLFCRKCTWFGPWWWNWTYRQAYYL